MMFYKSTMKNTTHYVKALNDDMMKSLIWAKLKEALHGVRKQNGSCQCFARQTKHIIKCLALNKRLICQIAGKWGIYKL